MYLIKNNCKGSNILAHKDCLRLIFWTFVIHQPLVVILRLLDTEIAGHGVHGDEWLVEPFVQASNRLTQGIVFLNNDHWGL